MKNKYMQAAFVVLPLLLFGVWGFAQAQDVSLELTVPALALDGQEPYFSGRELAGSVTIANTGTGGGNEFYPLEGRIRKDLNNNGTWDETGEAFMLYAGMSPARIPVDRSITLPIARLFGTTARSGTHRIEFCVDPANQWTETDERNNCIERTFTLQSGTDFGIDPASGILPTNPAVESRVTFQTTLRNYGNLPAQNVPVRARIDTDSDGTWDADFTAIVPSIGGTTQNIGWGSYGEGAAVTWPASAVWTASAGRHTFEVCANPDGVAALRELIPGNNCRTQVVTVAEPNLELAVPALVLDGQGPWYPGRELAGSVTISNTGSGGGNEYYPLEGRIRKDLNNNGTWDETGVIFELYAGMSPARIPVDQSITLPIARLFEATSRTGTHKIEFCVDPSNRWAETDEGNNCIEQTFTLQSGTDFGIDPSSGILPANPAAESRVTFQTTLINYGNLSAQNIPVRARIDTDSDGTWDADFNTIVPSIGGTTLNVGWGSHGASAVVNWPASAVWTASAGRHTFEVCANPDGVAALRELIPGNNCRTQVVTVFYAAEDTRDLCYDRLDNDNDGLADFADPDCASHLECTLNIAPASASVVQGAEVALRALYDSDGPNGFGPEEDVTRAAVWQSNDSRIASSQGNGIFRAEALGNAGVSASYASCPDVMARADIAVTRVPNHAPVLSSCAVHTEGSRTPVAATYGSAARDADGDALAYYWNFGFGVREAQSEGTFVYDRAGSYTVTLKVKDPDGAWSNEMICGTVTALLPPPPENTRTACFDRADNDEDGLIDSFDPDCAGFVQCTLTISPPSTSLIEHMETGFRAYFDPDGPNGLQSDSDVTDSARWESRNIAVLVLLHQGRFRGERVGEADVTATLDTCAGVVATAEGSVLRQPNHAPELTSCSLDPDHGAAPLGVRYSAQARDEDGDVLVYHWNFGFGERITDASGTFVYRDPGVYTTTLTITDARGEWSRELACGTIRVERPLPPENTRAVCRDGRDNDGDGRTDIDDPECAPFLRCTLVIVPPLGTVIQGESVAYRAVFDQDGPDGPRSEEDVSRTAEWASRHKYIATSQGQGVLRGDMAGSAELEARYASCPDAVAIARLDVTWPRTKPASSVSTPTPRSLKPTPKPMVTAVSPPAPTSTASTSPKPKPTLQSTPIATTKPLPIVTPPTTSLPTTTEMPVPSTPITTQLPVPSPVPTSAPQPLFGASVKGPYIGIPSSLTLVCPQNAAILTSSFMLENVGSQAALFAAEPKASWLSVYIVDPDASEALIRNGTGVTVTVVANCAGTRTLGSQSGSISFAARNITTGDIFDAQTMVIKVGSMPSASNIFRIPRWFMQSASALWTILGF